MNSILAVTVIEKLELIKSVIGDKFDGTIIEESTVDNTELEGPTEVVL